MPPPSIIRHSQGEADPEHSVAIAIGRLQRDEREGERRGHEESRRHEHLEGDPPVRDPEDPIAVPCAGLDGDERERQARQCKVQGIQRQVHGQATACDRQQR